ncbi:4-phosphoerythronate dehydrogenase [Aliiglaciecola litoralis]|uniref:Erythronate-4-phosphate dehydrogenase n=1 Tax=Aliiglaciecola litoralis TaxID=582857 RepID=A0ABN1LNX5_9ALTE
MNILYEDSMPYAQHYFPKLGNARAFSSHKIVADDLQDIDVLLVRSTTKVNEALLSKANKLVFVGTATAGSDHLDKGYLDARFIPWTSAAGCNAIAVAEYVLSCLMLRYANELDKLVNSTVGIVGAGHVGTALNKRLTALGIQTKLCDPPLQQQGDPREFVSLEQICRCDVISLHVPFVDNGPHPTQHMFDSERLAMLGPEQLLINACRGEVIDNQALYHCIQQGRSPTIMMDVWENEPNILFDLIPLVDVATAHIAGHSLEGKARGTFMLYQHLCQHFGLEETLTFASCLPHATALQFDHLHRLSPMEQVREAIFATYNVAQDSMLFKQQVNSADAFVYSRKHYAIRREFASVPLITGNFNPTEALYRLGFRASEGCPAK